MRQSATVSDSQRTAAVALGAANQAFGSTGDQIDGVIKSAQVAGVTGNGHSLGDARYQHDRRVDDVGRGGGGAELSRSAGASGVEWVDDHAM